MARKSPPVWRIPFLNLRVLEWALVAGIIFSLMNLYTYQTTKLQGQAELSAIKMTLGVLRTALVLEHLKNHVSPGHDSDTELQRNPFELLEIRPANYLGEATPAQAAAAAPGSWVFDPECVCVGYRPIYAEWFDSASGSPWAWFLVRGGPDALQISAKETYVWQGEALN
jgi:hypothetical protein